MNKVKVMIVDDSSIVRKILGDIITADPNLEVVDKVSNGKIALTKLTISKPDIITLDIEMPELNGLETLKALKQIDQKTKVIMCSSLTKASAKTTLEALSLGANDFITKPEGGVSPAVIFETLKKELIPKIYSACEIVRNTSFKTQHVLNPASVQNYRVDLVVIGVSTGGPSALEHVIPKLPGNLAVPVIVVQHMPPVFTKSLAERLNSLSALKVMEAFDGQEIFAGGVFIAPGGKHIVLDRLNLATTVIRTNEDPPENSCRPAVDVLFRSAATTFGKNTLALVMTGMGYDGTKGGKQIVDIGGQLIIQDKETSVVWGMPGAIAEAGFAQAILPLDNIAQDILTRVYKFRSLRRV
ncbi:MAG: chemotaxis response regulator protein-glutamate methylesterase [Deltaproteobacteria bacterium]|jgi:two-component system chemotaxis response regulator CheB|nr:chemotaxis response regulator protein-glutamate methylesterase [Deltaproteobacteria bacterium]